MSNINLFKALLILLLLSLYLTPISCENEMQTDIYNIDDDSFGDIYTTESFDSIISMETVESDDTYIYDDEDDEDDDDDDSESQDPQTTDSNDTSNSDGKSEESRQSSASTDSNETDDSSDEIDDIDDDTQSLARESSETDDSYANASKEEDVYTTASAESADDHNESSNESESSADTDTDASSDTDTNRRSGRTGSVGQSSKNENTNTQKNTRSTGELNWAVGIAVSLITISMAVGITMWCYVRNMMMKDTNMMSDTMALDLSDTDVEEGIAMTTHVHRPSMILPLQAKYGRLKSIQSGVQLMDDHDSVEINIVDDVDDALIQ
eukprot:345477_1